MISEIERLLNLMFNTILLVYTNFTEGLILLIHVVYFFIDLRV